jgi:hypothetical protein
MGRVGAQRLHKREIARSLDIMLRKSQPPKQRRGAPGLHREQPLADGHHDLPHNLAARPEEGQVEGLVERLEHATDGRGADGHDVDGAELGALEMRRLSFGQRVGDVELDLHPSLGLLLERLVQDGGRQVGRAVGADGGAHLPDHWRGGCRLRGGGRDGDEEGQAETQHEGEQSRHRGFSFG